MRSIILCFCLGTILLSCNNGEGDKTAGTTSSGDTTNNKMATVDLPYKASYSSSWSTNVSDADLKSVLMTYKDWENGNISGIAKAMADTISVDMSNGEHIKASTADLMKRWGSYRDSLSSVKIDMGGWQKMYSTDKKESFVVTWYDETDTFKDGKVDAGSYHDINQVKDGKITWYAQYKRPKK